MVDIDPRACSVCGRAISKDFKCEICGRQLCHEEIRTFEGKNYCPEDYEKITFQYHSKQCDIRKD